MASHSVNEPGHPDLHTTIDARLDALEASNGKNIVRLIYANGAYPARPTGLPDGFAEYVGPVLAADRRPGDSFFNLAP